MFGIGFCGAHRGGGPGGRHRRGRWHRRGAWDEVQGRGGGDFMRAGRMLAQGDLRLIALALIAEQPRHGYDIIKQLEERTSGWYSPSPGIVYPTLTYLEEAEYLASQSDGAKRLYSITEEGRAYLAENREVVDAVMSRLAYIGKKAARMRERFAGENEGDRSPPLVKAALDNLRDVAARRLQQDPRSEARVVEILARAAGELREE